MKQVTIDQAMELAVQHHKARRLEQADQLCRQILTIQPNHADALNLMGILAHHAGRNDIAVDLARRAIAINPTAEYHSNLGNFLQVDGQSDQAIAAYLQAIKLAPHLAAIHNNLGSAFTSVGQLDDAVAAHQAAIDIDPALTQAHNNLGNALIDLGHVDQSINAYRAAISLKPDYAQVHWNLSMALLLKGEYPEGWSEYEWRWRCENESPRQTTQPLWDGSDLTGRTILLHAEQGFGDTLQFIRYLPMVQSRGGKVIVECQPELISLLQQIPGPSQWIPRGQPLPPFDVHRPLLSLSFVFNTTLQSVPEQKPLLNAPIDQIEQWRQRIAGNCDGFKIGIAWAGNSQHKNDHNRSLPFPLLAPLLSIPQIQFFSLQKGIAAVDNVLDITADLHNFTDTAALISNLDLVISVDTAVAHLAGAIGKPVWLLLPFAPDWRWLQQRDDSPWYPTMRLFRQPQIGDWPSVIDHVRTTLLQLRP